MTSKIYLWFSQKME